MAIKLRDENEWKECRATIGRLDGVVADFRKYSFGLVTALITATGLIGQQSASQAAYVAVPIAIMVLILALFAVDRYYTLLLNAAVERALDLEGPTIDREYLVNDTLTQVISVYAHDSRATLVVTPSLYVGLFLATTVLAAAMSGQWPLPDSSVIGTLVGCITLGGAYLWYTEHKRPTRRF